MKFRFKVRTVGTPVVVESQDEGIAWCMVIPYIEVAVAIEVVSVLG